MGRAALWLTGGHVLRAVPEASPRTAMQQLDLTGVTGPDRIEAILDQAWQAFTSPSANATVQLWVAAYTDPTLAQALRPFEEEVQSIVLAAARTLFPDLADNDPAFPTYIDAATALIRGLAFAAPVLDHDHIHRRWQAVKRLLIQTATGLEPAADVPDPANLRK